MNRIEEIDLQIQALRDEKAAIWKAEHEEKCADFLKKLQGDVGKFVRRLNTEETIEKIVSVDLENDRCEHISVSFNIDDDGNLEPWVNTYTFTAEEYAKFIGWEWTIVDQAEVDALRKQAVDFYTQLLSTK